jgi:rubrerythrin
MASQDSPPPQTIDDPVYRTGVIELLGILAYGEISACERLAEDAKMAPDLKTKVEIATMASAEFEHFVRLRDRLVEMGEDPYETMTQFRETFERFHTLTSPSDWLEGLIKAYVGDGLAADFYREIAAYLDADTRALVLDTLSGTGHSEFVIDAVRGAIEADPRVGGRLALWGRRLMGEALSQAQMVVAERDALSVVLVGGVDHPGMDLAGIGRMFTRITEAHAERMAKLGLAA